jgi:hypothetical protein
MATVQLSDIIDVRVFQDLPSVNGVEKTELFQSGIVTSSPLLNALANDAGKVAELPFWNDIDESSAPNISSSDPTVEAGVEKVTQGEQISRKASLNKAFSASDLASELAKGPRAMEHIRSRVDRYWARQWQRRLIASANGVLADNIAANSSDMVHSVAGATNANVTANTVFTRSNFTTAAFSLGDMVDGITAIAVHSAIMKRMVDNDDIDYVKDSEGNILLATYLGRRIIMDDSLPYTPAAGSGSGDAAPRFTSILFGPGAFGYGEGSPLNPVELERKASQGNGAGVENLWTRKTWILHPYGYQNTGTPAGQGGFNTTELAAATTWARVIARKNIPLAFLVTNG